MAGGRADKRFAPRFRLRCSRGKKGMLRKPSRPRPPFARARAARRALRAGVSVLGAVVPVVALLLGLAGAARAELADGRVYGQGSAGQKNGGEAGVAVGSGA